MQDLTISVADILDRPGELRDFSVSAALTDVRTALARLTDAPIRADVRAESVLEGVLVTGRIQGSSVLQCARCLTTFPGDVSLDVCELFVPRGDGVPAEEDAYEFAGTDLVLEPMVRDAVTLALPLAPLCRDACRGLCPTCGQDLNVGTCDCTDNDVDPRWAALTALRDRLEG